MRGLWYSRTPDTNANANPDTNANANANPNPNPNANPNVPCHVCIYNFYKSDFTLNFLKRLKRVTDLHRFRGGTQTHHQKYNPPSNPNPNLNPYHTFNSLGGQNSHQGTVTPTLNPDPNLNPQLNRAITGLSSTLATFYGRLLPSLCRT
jgi:hypothetical protein